MVAPRGGEAWTLPHAAGTGSNADAVTVRCRLLLAAFLLAGCLLHNLDRRLLVLSTKAPAAHVFWSVLHMFSLTYIIYLTHCVTTESETN